ncbi:MAG: 2-hydroxyacid dehydrogenase [candidate division KSB1 bacterium]|nr:2-hydroxyacid dehydrogenase [candidate division KSB1 bacterium]
MKVAVFSTRPYDRFFLEKANKAFGHELTFYEPHLTFETISLAAGFPAICVFVNDRLDARTLVRLHEIGTDIIALRCAGFNNLDLDIASTLGMQVVRVPAYSPHAVAEHTVGLLLAVNRKFHRAFNRVREGNFALDGLLGFELHGKTVGIVGTGKIGAVVARILKGFGCELLGYDVMRNPECEALGLQYVELPELFRRADIISLHCPLTPQTHHLIDAEAIALMKKGVVLINTSRGGLIDTRAVIRGLKSGKIGYLGLDVYEEEEDLFFEDHSEQVIQDDVFARLLTFPNVLITAHQAFFTETALTRIAETTLQNLADLEAGRECPNAISPDSLRRQAAA